MTERRTTQKSDDTQRRPERSRSVSQEIHRLRRLHRWFGFGQVRMRDQKAEARMENYPQITQMARIREESRTRMHSANVNH